MRPVLLERARRRKFTQPMPDHVFRDEHWQEILAIMYIERQPDKITKAKETKSKTPIKTWSRRSMITPDFVGLTFAVHNGKIFSNF